MAAEVDPKKKKKSAAAQLKSVWPMIWELVVPRRLLLGFSFILLLIGRLCGLVLPASTKFLIDDVITRHRPDRLAPLVAVVAGATLVQGLTSFSLTQLLSKEAQRLITELRRKVQTHVGRLSLNYYDSNKTGALVSRIMNDVEGIRNLIGTGLVDFCGGVLTAILALGFLLKIDAQMTGIAIGFLLVLMVALSRAFKVIRPIFRERAKINAEVTGRLTESLGGVRVVKGYHAEDRESNVFAAGVKRLLDNVLKTLTATSLMGLSSTVILGIVSSIIMYLGARQILAGHMTIGGLFSYTMFMGFLIAPVAQVASIGTQITEALAGLDRTREVLAESREDQDSERSVALDNIDGAITFEHVDFSYEPGKPCGRCEF